MKQLKKELEIGEIHVRDLWQFELKSEFIPLTQLEENQFAQEFFIFIPNALQVNRNTYKKGQFYQDLTNMIRYKTPEFTLKQILNPNNNLSPISRTLKLIQNETTDDNRDKLEDELKLLGNIVRSSLRDRIGDLIEEIKNNNPDLSEHILRYCEEVKELRRKLREIDEEIAENWRGVIREHFHYIDEFISISISYTFTALLEELRKHFSPSPPEIDEAISQIILQEKKHRIEHLKEPKELKGETEEEEHFFYRAGLLNKFVLDALLLTTQRTGVRQKFQHVIGAVAAGIAMLIFLLLFVWGGEVFVINSMPFIFITVLFYILKDRIKEGLKALSYQWVLKWLYDYKTDIRSPDDLYSLGNIKESFSFINEKMLPKEIINIRNREFHAVLEEFKRPERVIYYKKEVLLNHTQTEDIRRRNFNMITRFNIGEFLKKADDPLHPYIELDPNTEKLINKKLPKVYHINIIMRNYFLDTNQDTIVETKKFRLILDKNGIKRVEHLTG